MIGPSLLSRWVRAKWLHRMICRGTVINYWLFARCAFPESFLILDIHDFNAMIPNTACCLSSFGSAEHRWFHVVSPVDRKLVLRWNLRYYVWIWLRALNITSHINQVIWYIFPRAPFCYVCIDIHDRIHTTPTFIFTLMFRQDIISRFFVGSAMTTTGANNFLPHLPRGYPTYNFGVCWVPG